MRHCANPERSALLVEFGVVGSLVDPTARAAGKQIEAVALPEDGQMASVEPFSIARKIGPR
jgi:hypothetical protein